MIRALALPVLVGLALAAAAARAHEEHERAAASAPSSTRLYELPEPGSYELPPIDRVAEYDLLAPDGSSRPLPGLQPDEVAVVAFVYRSCSEADGCPLALSVLKRLDGRLAAADELGKRVKLACVSFDPQRDTPERMGELRELLEPKGRWEFLTARDARSLEPILADYGQDVTTLLGPEGRETGLLGHVLKVFLIDGARDVRNVYSAGYLDAELVLTDVRTLLERPAQAEGSPPSASPPPALPSRSAD